MKKILLAGGAIAAVLVAMPMFAAWEAHVVNVTAQIENALSVPVDSIDFGTIFPQEHLDKSLNIGLSTSFSAEDQADQVTYVIRQKPKCGFTLNNGTELIPGTTVTGHVFPLPVPDNLSGHTIVPFTDKGYYVDCGVTPVNRNDGSTFGLLPMLCPYISKHPDNKPEVTEGIGNDGSLNSFHLPFAYVAQGGINPFTNEEATTSGIVWNDTKGKLDKTTSDLTDAWTIDVAAPCFKGQCAQDWANFVHSFNANANPDDYVQDNTNEHKVFGCDLWVETTGVHRTVTQCNDNVDNDGDGLIDQADPACSPDNVYNPALDNENLNG